MTRPRHTKLDGLAWAGVLLGAASIGAAPAAEAPGAAQAGGAAQPGAAPASYSAAALYNEANAFVRAGKPGMAVLYYERARLLAPGDPDIAANLRVVREAAKLTVEPPGSFERAVTRVGPATASWLGLAGVLLAGGGLLAARADPRRRRIGRAAAALGLVLMGFTACHAWVLWPTLHEGVVLTASAPVLVSPVPMSDPVFVLPEAETVRITAEHEGYALIRTRAGRTGWVADANLAAVVPAAP